MLFNNTLKQVKRMPVTNAIPWHYTMPIHRERITSGRRFFMGATSAPMNGRNTRRLVTRRRAPTTLQRLSPTTALAARKALQHVSERTTVATNTTKTNAPRGHQLGNTPPRRVLAGSNRDRTAVVVRHAHHLGTPSWLSHHRHGNVHLGNAPAVKERSANVATNNVGASTIQNYRLVAVSSAQFR
jgi:hypothetical protein